MPFVTENIGKKATAEDWRLREAATFAFGSMLEGPSPSAMAEIVRQAMGFLLAVSLGCCIQRTSTNAQGGSLARQAWCATPSKNCGVGYMQGTLFTPLLLPCSCACRL
jgi:hypothetical protein